MKYTQPELLQEIWEKPATLAVRDFGYSWKKKKKAYEMLNAEGVIHPNAAVLLFKVEELVYYGHSSDKEEAICGCLESEEAQEGWQQIKEVGLKLECSESEEDDQQKIKEVDLKHESDKDKANWKTPEKRKWN